MRKIYIMRVTFSIFLLIIWLESFAQKDTTIYIFGFQVPMISKIQAKEFTSGYSSNIKPFYFSIEAGYLKVSAKDKRVYNGFSIKIFSTAKDALYRTYTGTVGDFGRYHTAVFWDKVGLKTVSLGYTFFNRFSEKRLSGWYLNPEFILGVMNQSIKREFAESGYSESLGFNPSGGCLICFSNKVALKIDAGFRIIKIDPIVNGLGIVHWNGFHASIGLSLVL